jgi:hypothetical protein
LHGEGCGLREIAPSTSREPDSPPRKQPKRSSKTALKKYLTEDDLERLLYDSDEDIDEWALLTKDDEASSEQEVEDEELEDRNLGEDDEGTADEQEESRQSPLSSPPPPPSTSVIDWQKTGDLVNFQFEKTEQFLVPYAGKNLFL